MQGGVIAASIVLAFTAAAAAGWAACQAVRRPAYAQVGKAPSQGRLAWLVRNGIAPLRAPARWLLGLAPLNAQVARVRVLVEERVGMASDEALASIGLAAALALFAASTLVSWSVPCGLAVVAVACIAGTMRMRSAEAKRATAVLDAVPDALRAMGTCFQAGLTLMQTFRQVAAQTEGPLAKLFNRAAHRLETGQSAQQALATFRQSDAAGELAFVSVALDVQHQAGGSMKQVLDAACETVEGELALKRALRVQTAQAKLSAQVVTVLPFALIAVFSLVSEGFLQPFFSSFAGVLLLSVALVMQAAGILLVRRMLSVEVG